MCGLSKEHITENWCKRDTITRKTDCLFDTIALLEADGWTFCSQNSNHNHEITLARAHPTHRKAARIKNVLESGALL